MRQLLLSEANKAVTMKEGKLYFNEIEIQCTKQYKDGRIAALYMVRVYDERNYPVIVSGLDLMKDGKVWLGSYPIKMWKDGQQAIIPSAHYDDFETVEHILNNLCADTIGKKWIIVEEEDFDQSFAD